ncbi:ABC-F family ATP-binding cassette domain-containing protein [Photorhabdus caribbeanensis]|uniref:ABC-F family ATP-binding cassette domain-containing protein n=1 Tax=Photorhabdus caribbeanensis TaxID=1004165 RepID=UPI001BD4CBCA|nr:ABC-F family ATP-binding cassette domain-containing protein [Photorhabdus caribbeanensis]
MKNKNQTFITAENIHYQSSENELFKGLSVSLNQNDKVGLIGFNGSGKSTLLKIISKNLSPNSGTVTHANNLKFYMIEQHFPDSLLDFSLLDATLSVLPCDESYSSGWKAETVLTGIGFRSEHFHMKCSSLSGGQKTKILIARALLLEPNTLLLDEPSNHLDLPTMLWLEQFLSTWKGCLITVSHDRRLLDNVTNCSWIISNNTLYKYGYPCSNALIEHQKLEDTLQLQHAAEEQEIRRLESSAKQLATWGKNYDSNSLSKKAQSMFKRIDKLKEQQCETIDDYPWYLTFPGRSLPANKIIDINNFNVQLKNSTLKLFNITDFTATSGDRIAILGENGCGKSTFLEYVWHNYITPVDNISEIQIHPKAIMAYYDQTLHRLDDKYSLIDALIMYCDFAGVSVDNETCKKALIKAGFTYNRLFSKIETLSGGERARVLLLGISLIDSHIIMLDEPTNHLDFIGKTELAEQLRAYPGTLILVSHDREFLEKVCNRFFVINNGKLIEYNDSNSAYKSMYSDTSINNHYEPKNSSVQSVPVNDKNDDELLKRLFELEELLQEDKKRKNKHQKPDLQTIWHKEINEINKLLNLN